MDPERAGPDERGPDEGVAERARPAAFALQELPRDVEDSLMSRDNILHKVRTALGRSAGQAVADVPPVRLRVPEAAMEDRIASDDGAAGGAGGQDGARADDGRGARVRGGGDRGQDGGGVERAVFAGVRDCGPARRAQRNSRRRGIDGSLRQGGYRHHQRGLRAERYRDAGDVGESGRSAPGVAIAARAFGGGARANAFSPGWTSCSRFCRIRRRRPVPWC